MKNMLGKAIAITAEAFKDKKDRGGQPYILHCLEVMNGVKHLGEEVMCIAVMHDLIEDTDYNVSDLEEMGFPERVVKGVKFLTRLPQDSYEFYIKVLSLNEDARAVKLKDLEHNSNPLRLKRVNEKDLKRIEKYHKAYLELK